MANIYSSYNKQFWYDGKRRKKNRESNSKGEKNEINIVIGDLFSGLENLLNHEDDGSFSS